MFGNVCVRNNRSIKSIPNSRKKNNISGQHGFSVQEEPLFGSSRGEREFYQPSYLPIPAGQR